RAVLGELHHVGRRHVLEEPLGGLGFDDRRPDEVAALLQLAAHRFEDPRVGVAEADGSQSRAVLDVLVAVDVPDVPAAAVRDDRGHPFGILVRALGVGVRTARDDPVQPLVRLRGAGQVRSHVVAHLVGFNASPRDGARSSRSLTIVTVSGHEMSNSVSLYEIVMSSSGSCARSIRYETSEGSVSDWNPCAHPAGMYKETWVSPESSKVFTF